MKISARPWYRFMVFLAFALFALASFPARAETDEAIVKKMWSLNDVHREMFAAGEFATLDAEMNKIQLEYEKGKWTDSQLWSLFSLPFATRGAMFEGLYDKWEEAYPKSYAAHYVRGAYYLWRAQELAGDSKQAVEARRAAAVSMQDHAASLSLTAKPLLTVGEVIALYGMVNDRDNAKKMFETIKKIDPKTVLVRSTYMYQLDRIGATAEMRALAEDTRKTGRDDDVVATLETFDKRLLRESLYAELDGEMNRVQRDYEAGKIGDETLERYFGIFENTDAHVEEKLEAWGKAYPNSYAARQAGCTHFLHMASAARGDRFIRDTSAKELEGMEFYLRRAEGECEAAVALAKKPILAYKEIMGIALLGGGRETSRQMLDLADTADPKNVIVRVQYMFSLQPNWGGSLQEMKNFLAQSKQAGVSGGGQRRLNDQILTVLMCNTCTGLDAFSKIGTVITGF